jgi:putative ABC transport system substrate-binding protein
MRSRTHGLVDLRAHSPYRPGMDRRRFLLTSLAGARGAPLAAGAQQTAGKLWRIGVLSFTRFPGSENQRIEAFRQGLRDLGYVEGRNLTIEYRYSDGKDDMSPVLAAELVRLRVSVIATYGTKATRAAKQATSSTPVVMLTVLDPVGAELVASLSRPGGNITGLSEVSVELSAKRLELLKEAAPSTSSIAVLIDRATRRTRWS